MRVIYPEDTKLSVPQVVTEVVQEDGTIEEVGSRRASEPSGFCIEFSPIFSTGITMSGEDSSRLSLLF